MLPILERELPRPGGELAVEERFGVLLHARGENRQPPQEVFVQKARGRDEAGAGLLFFLRSPGRRLLLCEAGEKLQLHAEMIGRQNA